MSRRRLAAGEVWGLVHGGVVLSGGFAVLVLLVA
jgi:hypothetical protein